MADSLSAGTGADYRMAFRMHTIAHHREGIRMADELLPRLTRPELRTIADRMKADQARDSRKLESEIRQSRPGAGRRTLATRPERPHTGCPVWDPSHAPPSRLCHPAAGSCLWTALVTGPAGILPVLRG